MYEDWDTGPPDSRELMGAAGAMELDRPPGTWINTDANTDWTSDWHRRQAGFPAALSPNTSRSPPGTRWPRWRALFRPDGIPRYHTVAITAGNIPSMGAYGEGFMSSRPVWSPIVGNTFPQWPWLGPQASPSPTGGGRRETISGQPVRLTPGRGARVGAMSMTALQSGEHAMHEPSGWDDRRSMHDRHD